MIYGDSEAIGSYLPCKPRIQSGNHVEVPGYVYIYIYIYIYMYTYMCIYTHCIKR